MRSRGGSVEPVDESGACYGGARESADVREPQVMRGVAQGTQVVHDMDTEEAAATEAEMTGAGMLGYPRG